MKHSLKVYAEECAGWMLLHAACSGARRMVFECAAGRVTVEPTDADLDENGEKHDGIGKGNADGSGTPQGSVELCGAAVE